MKNISVLLVFLLLLQSCNVYDTPTSLRVAVGADKKAKVTTTGKQKYKFIRLETKNGQLTGITKKNSSTAKKLSAMPSEVDGKFVEIDLSNVEIENVQLRNESVSVILTVATFTAVLYAGYYAVGSIMFSGWGT